MKERIGGILDDLVDLRLFERIVATGSLSAAARETGQALAVVSKRLSRLESRLQVRLLNRSTRKLSLTEEGALLHAEALKVLAAVDHAEATVLGRHDRVVGTLRISAPNSLGRRVLVPAIADFARQHPALEIQLSLSDEVVELIQGGFDLAIRYGRLADSRLIARELAPNRRVLVASPEYARRFGLPRAPADLARHDCILIGTSPSADWGFGPGEGASTVRVRGRFVCDDGEAAHLLALQGMGIAMKSIWDVGDDLSAGRLLQVLPRQAITAAPLHAVYLHGRHLAPRVRLFVDYLIARLRQAWRWG